MRNEALSVIAVSRTVVPNQVMRQLMTQNHPPIDNGVRGVSRLLQERLLLQRLEIEVIAEDTACTVECNCLAARVVEDTETVGPHGENGAGVKQDRRKEVEPRPIGGQEGGSVCD